jgi:hypothetical protein
MNLYHLAESLYAVRYIIPYLCKLVFYYKGMLMLGQLSNGKRAPAARLVALGTRDERLSKHLQGRIKAVV